MYQTTFVNSTISVLFHFVFISALVNWDPGFQNPNLKRQTLLRIKLFSQTVRVLLKGFLGVSHKPLLLHTTHSFVRRTYVYCFKNTFVANAFISTFHHTNNAYWGILYTTALLCFPKNLIPWRDSNPGLIVPEAEPMYIACYCRKNASTEYLINHALLMKIN
jgi:hypothetical protein